MPRHQRTNSPAGIWSTAAACCIPTSRNEEGEATLPQQDHDDNGSISLRSNSSLQTLPSLPSLQIHHPSQTAPATTTTISLLSSLTTQPTAVTSLAATSTSPLPFLYCASQSEIVVFDLASLRRVDTFSADPDAGSIKSLAFSPDGTRVFTAHQDSKIRVWTVRSPDTRHRLLASLPTLTDRLRRFVLPSNYVVIRRHKKRLWIEHADAVSAVAAANGLLYSVSWDKTLKIWCASDLRCLQSIKAHEDAVNSIAVSSDGTVYTGSADCRIRVWGRAAQGDRRHSLVATLEKHKSAVNALSLSADGSVLYSGACDRSILVWERGGSASAGHMAVAGALRGHGKAIMCLICVDDLLFSGSTDRTVRIWRRLGSGEYCCLCVMTCHARGVRSLVAYQVNGTESESKSESEYRVCSGSSDGEVRIWRVLISSDSQLNNPSCSSDSSCGGVELRKKITLAK